MSTFILWSVNGQNESSISCGRHLDGNMKMLLTAATPMHERNTVKMKRVHLSAHFLIVKFQRNPSISLDSVHWTFLHDCCNSLFMEFVMSLRNTETICQPKAGFQKWQWQQVNSRTHWRWLYVNGACEFAMSTQHARMSFESLSDLIGGTENGYRIHLQCAPCSSFRRHNNIRTGRNSAHARKGEGSKCRHKTLVEYIIRCAVYDIRICGSCIRFCSWSKVLIHCLRFPRSIGFFRTIIRTHTLLSGL